MNYKPFYYNQQIKNYLIQFMAIFAGLQVQTGKGETEEERLISVPIFYGNRDRVVAHIIGENTQNKPLRLPAMSAFLVGFDLASDQRHGIGTIRRETYLPRGGLFPDDITTVTQLMPVPFWVNMELMIYVSNTDQRLQILEQILPLFDPTLQIQKNDALLDWTKITTVELTGIRKEDNYPIGTDRRILQIGLDFKFLAFLSLPAEVKNNFVKDIYFRIGTLTNAIANAKNTAEIVNELDEQGVVYELLISGDNVEIH